MIKLATIYQEEFPEKTEKALKMLQFFMNKFAQVLPNNKKDVNLNQVL